MIRLNTYALSDVNTNYWIAIVMCWFVPCITIFSCTGGASLSPFSHFVPFIHTAKPNRFVHLSSPGRLAPKRCSALTRNLQMYTSWRGFCHYRSYLIAWRESRMFSLAQSNQVPTRVRYLSGLTYSHQTQASSNYSQCFSMVWECISHYVMLWPSSLYLLFVVDLIIWLSWLRHSSFFLEPFITRLSENMKYPYIGCHSRHIFWVNHWLFVSIINYSPWFPQACAWHRCTFFFSHSYSLVPRYLFSLITQSIEYWPGIGLLLFIAWAVYWFCIVFIPSASRCQQPLSDLSLILILFLPSS